LTGHTSFRTADNLNGEALTYAEIKDVPSGSPAVMEKVKIDTEIRNLDKLHALQPNQRHTICWQIRALAGDGSPTVMPQVIQDP